MSEIKSHNPIEVSRRRFLATGTFLAGGLFFSPILSFGREGGKMGVSFPHFPTKLHALVWRNWFLVPVETLASVVGGSVDDVVSLGKQMGLPSPKEIPKDQFQRSYLTIIRRNWHLLPREQLLQILDWTEEKLTFTLQEDDFFYIKLGSLKPLCEPIRYEQFSAASAVAAQRIAQVLKKEFSSGFPKAEQPLFHFVKELSAPFHVRPQLKSSGFSNRFGYAYFALFGDPLLEPDLDPYPDAYLDRMVDAGMGGTWIHIVLSKVTPFPWEPERSEHWQTRLQNLRSLVARAKKHGIGIYLYLNEPRYLPLTFFEQYPDLKGAIIGDQAALCTSHPDVQRYLVDSIATIVNAIPDLAGFFSITASENHTHCWSHGKGAGCPRCSKRAADAVIAELNGLYVQGIQRGRKEADVELRAKGPELIAWDWGWRDGWAEKIIPKLSKEVALMSVSEWDLETRRGGVVSKVGEYSISTVGPGPRALKHWKIARENGLKTIAKIQAGNTWEIAAVPYIPALANVARHAANLRAAGVDGLMLGWTLGGYPSPNLEVVAVIGQNPDFTPQQAMNEVAQNRFGAAAQSMVIAWEQFSEAFSEFPYNVGVVYNAPLQVGPSNLLWEIPTGYAATMVGIPYDDLKSWRSVYPPEVFEGQLRKVAEGFNNALQTLKKSTKGLKLSNRELVMLQQECAVAETVAIHYESISNQVNIIMLRDGFSKLTDRDQKEGHVQKLRTLLKKEIILSKKMNYLQNADSKLGFEATNHYFYIPSDLVEKVINCHDLIDRWLPSLLKS